MADRPRWLSAQPPWLAAAALIVVTVIAYLPALNGGFVWDDDTSLNRFVKSADGLRRFWLTTQTPDYWPVTSTTFWIEWRLWGMNPLGYHATNLVLHVVECLLLWAILRRLRVPGAYLAALLFAVHPVNVQSVAWITQRKGLMAMLFYLLSIYFFIRAEGVGTGVPPVRGNGHPGKHGRATSPALANEGRPSLPINRWYCLSLLAFALALLSKGSVAILPLMLLGIVAWRRRIRAKDILRLAPFFLVAAILVLVDIWFQRHHLVAGEVVRNAGWLARLLGAGAVVWFYLLKALVPAHLVFFYPLWHIEPGSFEWWAPLLGAVGLTLLLWRKSLRAALFAWAYFCVALIPVMGFTDVYFMKFSLVDDHYQHLALIGVAALAGAAWARWHGRTPRMAEIAAILAVIGLAGLTQRQCLMYHDAETLLKTSLRGNPDSALGHNNLGIVYADTHRLPEAVEEFAEALRLDPGYADAQHNSAACNYNLGVIYAEANRLPDAIARFTETLRLDPANAATQRNLGLALARQGRSEEAIPHFEEALRLNASSADTHDDLGNALLRLHRPAEAVPHFEQAIRLNPADAEAQCNLAIALDHLGQPEEAIRHYEEALRLTPGNAVIQADLAAALARLQASTSGRP